MEEVIRFFNCKTTEEIAQYLLGMYLQHETEAGILGGYIVDAEAYLGPADEAAHSYGLRNTPRLKAMYDEPGTIYLYMMHTHLILNMVTQAKGQPQGVMIRALQPMTGLDQMEQNRKGRTGVELTNGPGKLVAALGITKELYGQSIFDSPLKIIPQKRKYPKQIKALPRIGIPNKGIWTDLPLRYVVAGNPYITKPKRAEIDREYFGWKDETNEKNTMLHFLDQQLTDQLADYDVAIDWDTKNHTIEVICRLFAENKAQTAIDDIHGTVSDEEVIEFEDGILFYHPEKSHFDREDFLSTIPYEGKKGLRKSVFVGFVSYLKEVLDEGQGALWDFLVDDQADVFELNWSDSAFKSAVEQAAQKVTQDDYLPYPSY